MLPKLKSLVAGAFSFLLVFGCDERRLEQTFFNQPFAGWLQRMRQYSLEDQYKIFRYGNDSIEAPLVDLADPIAERGAAAVPFLVGQLKSRTDDLTVRDILLIFQTMARLKSYDVKGDAALMNLLASKVAGVKHKEWRSVCFEMLQRIKHPNLE